MIHQQVFSLTDIPMIGILVLLEGLLSADNALVLALMVQHLPEEQRKKALLYGLGGAFIFRGVALIFAGMVLRLWWLQLLGALYLLYITLKHFFSHVKKDENGEKPVNKQGFWMTVFLVELTDIAFAVDSVLAAIGFIGDDSKLWVAYAGALIGVILLRFAATFFVKLLDKFPSLEHLAYGLVGWVGIKLLMMSGHSLQEFLEQSSTSMRLPFKVPEMGHTIFWCGMALIATVGLITIFLRDRRKLD